jgi:hypothetical protein
MMCHLKDALYIVDGTFIDQVSKVVQSSSWNNGINGDIGHHIQLRFQHIDLRLEV